MKKLLAISAVLLLAAGCDAFTPLTNEQIIAETKKCVDNGIPVELIRNGFNEILGVQCAPKENN